MQHATRHIVNPLAHVIKQNLQPQNGFDSVDQLVLSWLRRYQQQTAVVRTIRVILTTHIRL